MGDEYRFTEQLDVGKRGERFIDSLFAPTQHIQPVDLSLELIAGIDRIWKSKADGRVVGVEYKTDTTATRTGNMFIETTSNDENGKTGWVYSSLSQVIVYFIPDVELIVMNTLELKRHLPELMEGRKVMVIPNRGYNTRGFCIGTDEIKNYSRLTMMTWDVSGMDW